MSDKAESENATSDVEFPVAEIRQRRIAGLAASRLWWVSLVCFFVAVGLALRQVRTPGLEITIHFDQGHGLTEGDPVRFRGIDVGDVSSVALSESMDGVQAVIRLKSEAKSLAREGSRFWIERPRLSLSRVGGLETVVGPKYVGVQPGPIDARRRVEFQGLSEPPPAAEFSDGLVVILESSDRLGLQHGSPIRYRGVDVGHIMSVTLASDAAHVESRAYIRPEFRNLLRAESKFWSNSGLDLKVGIKGLQLDADTLATIAAGGVAMATPPSEQEEVASEHRFDLHDKAEDAWLEWEPQLSLQPRLLSTGTPVPNLALGVWRKHGFVRARFGSKSSWILPLDDRRIVGLSDTLQPSEKGNTLELNGKTVSLTPDRVQLHDELAISVTDTEFSSSWPLDKLRAAKDVEDLILVHGDGQTIEVNTARLSAGDNATWNVDSIVTLDDQWRGACAISVRNGDIVGLCAINDGVAKIVLITTELISSSRDLESRQLNVRGR